MENDSLTVLVVDDDDSERLLNAAFLRKNGFMALEAPDGATAMDIMRERDRELAAVISDVRMPGIDGLKLAEMNFDGGFLPFIVCTVISDAHMGLKFLKFGVRDYVVKPVVEEMLVKAVRNAIERRKLPRLFADDETPFPGNVGAITIPANLAAVHRAHIWLTRKLGDAMPPVEQRRFFPFLFEILMNAYEHGSLMISDDQKAALLDSGEYRGELRRRELECKAEIEVAVSTVGNEICVSIADDGYGFDYKHYQKMSEAEMLDRITRPSGRGIQMAMRYFDSVTFSKGGAKVMLTKKMPKS